MNKLPQTRHNEDRLRRAESWLERSRKTGADAEQADSSEDKAALVCEQFIFLWISFNAAYGRELLDNNNGYRNPKETGKFNAGKFNAFLKEIIKLDTDGEIESILWNTYSGPVRVLLDNRYVFGPFWDWVRGVPSREGWEKRFTRSKSSANRALGRRNVQRVLKEVFSRLYELRNQIFHGGVTIASGWGQSQIMDGSRIMASLIPKILEIMRADIEENPNSERWGKVAYPRINKSQDVYVGASE
jgi:hypothetical protein